MKNKEAHWMEQMDHLISRRIVDWCAAQNVTHIRLENLSGIRMRGKRNRKDRGRSLRSWGFYRLQRFIEYKAKLAGITGEFVNPRYTSQTCPKCGHQAKNNRYGIRLVCQKC
jgi:putative transposase